MLPRHYWEGKGADGEQRDLARASMDIPLGSGPYRIKDMEAGRSIIYERVKDWWAKDLPVTRGQWNFEQIQFVYYRDRLAAFEDFKAGKTDFWAEPSAKGWATGYDFHAVKRGLVKKELLATDLLKAMQGFAFNLRRKAVSGSARATRLQSRVRLRVGQPQHVLRASTSGSAATSRTRS